MPRSATCGTIGSVLLSRLRAWGVRTAEGSSHVGRGLRTTPMYLHGWRKARWDRAEIEEFLCSLECAVFRGFTGGDDGGVLQVILTLLSLFSFTKQVTEAWKAWPFAIISFILFLYIIFFSCILFWFLCIRGRQLSCFKRWDRFSYHCSLEGCDIFYLID